MIPLTIALTILLSSLFSLDKIIFMASGVLFFKGIASAWWGLFVYWLIVYGPWLAIAWYMLRRLKVASFAAQLSRGIRLAKIGIAISAVCLVLASANYFLSSIPYGGVSVLGILQLISLIGRGFLFAGLAVALVRELPAAERAAIHASRGSGT